jgi:hypothetical protein
LFINHHQPDQIQKPLPGGGWDRDMRYLELLGSREENPQRYVGPHPRILHGGGNAVFLIFFR